MPEHWIPLLPVQMHDADGKVICGSGAAPCCSRTGRSRCTVREAEALTVRANLLLYDEEVPREGVHVTRTSRLARWIDGSTWVWTAFRKQVGRGEGSSGLRFDQLRE